MLKDIGLAEVKINPADMDRAKAMLADVNNGFPKAFSRALNKSATGTKTDMVKLVREDYNYRAATLQNRMTVRRATYERLEAAVVSVGPGIHLTDIIGTRQTKKGVSVNVKKSTGRKLIKHAFIEAGRNSGKELVFRRKVIGERRVGRYPIEALYASHPEEVYNQPDNFARISAAASKRLDSNMAHEVDVVLKGVA